MDTRTWHVVGASVTGTSHLKTGRECEDDHAVGKRADGTLVLAVADGAGSAARAAEGSACAVDTVLTCLGAGSPGARQVSPLPSTQDSWLRLLQGVLQRVRAALEGLVNESGALGDVSTTLLCCLISDQWLVGMQVGDGALVIRRADGRLEAVTAPDHGEYVNQTTFVTSADYLARAQYFVQSAAGITGLALFTDGLERLALDMQTHQPHTPFFRPLFRFAAATDASTDDLVQFLSSDRVNERSDDDKTLVLAVR